jgi:hypothetical protein
VFHTLAAPAQAPRYAFMPSREQAASLEYRTSVGRVRARLADRGFVEVPSREADLAAYLSYEIDDGKTVVSSYPIYGQTGILSSHQRMTVDRSRPGIADYSTYSSYTPAYGVVGAGLASDVVYTRKLQLDMLDRAVLDRGEVRKVYEGRVVSSGTSPELNVVMGYMVEALFHDFPGRSGATRTVRLEIEDR